MSGREGKSDFWRCVTYSIYTESARIVYQMRKNVYYFWDQLWKVPSNQFKKPLRHDFYVFILFIVFTLLYRVCSRRYFFRSFNDILNFLKNVEFFIIFLERVFSCFQQKNDASNSWFFLTISFYKFQGHLGDQDFYTVLGMEYPELIKILPCGWNRQLCSWWTNHGYKDISAQFAKCNTSTYVYHGNCNTRIPLV